MKPSADTRQPFTGVAGVALAALLGCGGPLESPSAAGEPRLIAHRGGIVDERFAENSPGAVEAAIERGYFMVEVDVRESRDGQLVVHHDADFVDFYGDDRQLADMTWDEIRLLEATPGGSRPMQFGELAALSQGGIQLMIDTKPPEHGAAFYESMEAAMRQNGLLDEALIIGTPESRDWFRGKARVGVDRDFLESAAQRGEDVAALYFLFEHGRDLDGRAVRLAQGLGVLVVPSINVGHYADLPDHRKAAEADVRRMRALGVETFQIDSVYDSWLLE